MGKTIVFIGFFESRGSKGPSFHGARKNKNAQFSMVFEDFRLESCEFAFYGTV